MTFDLPDQRLPTVPPVIPTGYGRLPHNDEVLAHNEYVRAMLDLTQQQRKFVATYLACFDEHQSAIAVGIALDEAKKVGRGWLRQPTIAYAIERGLTYYQALSELRFGDIVQELRQVVFGNIRDFLDEEGVPDINAVPADDPRWRLVQEWHHRPGKFGDAKTVKFHNRMDAMEKLLRILAPVAAKGKIGEPEPGAGDVNVNVQNINIVPVPQGQFIPAPASPQQHLIAPPIPVIEHNPFGGEGRQPLPAPPREALSP